MTSRQLGIAGFVLALVSAVAGVAVVLSSTSVQYGQLLATVTQTQKDVAEIKQTLDKIAPPTIKHADVPAPVQPAPAVEQAEAPADWYPAFLADKCRLCPTCCASAAASEP